MAVMHSAAVAAARPRPKKQTPEQFYDSLDQDTKAELIKGEVVIMSPVSISHDRLHSFFFRILEEWVEMNSLGEVFGEQVEMRLGAQRYVPDISFVATAHLDRIQPTRIEGPADLVVEITSAETANRDWGVKMRDYEQAGVREYWLVNPLVEQLHVYTLNEGKYKPISLDEGGAYHSLLLPGFFILPQWLWPGPDLKPDARAALRALGRR